MTALFLTLVNMSITASWLVAAILLLRLFLKKAPRSFHCALWAMVAFRLICPISLESSLSLLPRQEPITVETFQAEPVPPSPNVQYGYVAYESDDGEITYSGTVAVNHTGGPFPILLWLTGIWIAGMCLMLLYGTESYLTIRRKTAPSICIGDGVWICDHIDSPFILGLLHPKIYLPSALESSDANYVLAHERSHLKRKDHWWKPIGFLLLCIYWFNPILWAAYILLCRDIELACDEKVVKELGTTEKKAYSTALLNCSLPRQWVAACPLAFGEVGVKARVKNVLNLLDNITVRKHPVSRSREETRDKTHRVHLRGNTFLNFIWNFTQVWIDNGVKPTYTYRVNEPGAMQKLFSIITGEHLSITVTDVSATGLTAVYSPRKVYDSENFILEGNYWLEYRNGNQWKKLEPLEPWIPRHIKSTIILPDKEKHIVEWSMIHGSLPAGKYRIGRTLCFMDNAIAHDLYAEFSVTD